MKNKIDQFRQRKNPHAARFKVAPQRTRGGCRANLQGRGATAISRYKGCGTSIGAKKHALPRTVSEKQFVQVPSYASRIGYHGWTRIRTRAVRCRWRCESMGGKVRAPRRAQGVRYADFASRRSFRGGHASGTCQGYRLLQYRDTLPRRQAGIAGVDSANLQTTFSSRIGRTLAQERSDLHSRHLAMEGAHPNACRPGSQGPAHGPGCGRG